MRCLLVALLLVGCSSSDPAEEPPPAGPDAGAPHDPFTKFITDPQGTMDALFRDGLLIEHKQLLRTLLDAG